MPKDEIKRKYLTLGQLAEYSYTSRVEMIKRLLRIVCVILVLPSICTAESIDIIKLNKSVWANIESPNFNILTNAGEKKGLEIARELEEFEYFLTRSIGFKQENLKEKIPFIIAKDDSTFSAMGIPEKTAGVYSSGDGPVIFLKYNKFMSSSSGGGNLGRTYVLHHLTYLFLKNCSENLDRSYWFSHGMAEYYSTYIKKGDQVIIGDMSLLWMRFASLIDKKGKIEKIDTESTLKATVDDYIYGPSGGGKDKESVHEYKARFNAHALALVHYLMSNDDHIKKMFKYLGLIKLGLSVDQAFSLAFSTTFAEFDRQVTDYINNDSISGNSYRIGKGGIELPEAECRVNRVLQKEVMGELYSKILMLSCDLVGREGQLKMHADLAAIYPGLAEDVLLRRISLDPGNKLQLTNLAGIYAYSGRCREAAEIYEKLMSSHGDYTWLLNNYAWFLVTATDGELRNTAKAVELAERAVSQKKSSDNLATLAEVYFAGGLLQKAVNTAKEAVLLEKDNDYLKGLLEKYNSALKK